MAVHMAACMAVPPPAWPPALPSRTFVLVLVLVLVLGDSAIGDANGALGRGRFWATAPPPSAPFRFPNPSCSRMAAACELACRIHRRQTPGSSVSCMSAPWPAAKIRFSELLRRLSSCRSSATQKSATALLQSCSEVIGVELFLTPVPEFSVVFRFRAYSRRHETEPESISPQDVLRQRGRRARWLLRDGAVQRESAVQRVTKIGILECGPSL